MTLVEQAATEIQSWRLSKNQNETGSLPPPDPVAEKVPDCPALDELLGIPIVVVSAADALDPSVGRVVVAFSVTTLDDETVVVNDSGVVPNPTGMNLGKASTTEEMLTPVIAEIVPLPEVELAIAGVDDEGAAVVAFDAAFVVGADTVVLAESIPVALADSLPDFRAPPEIKSITRSFPASI